MFSIYFSNSFTPYFITSSRPIIVFPFSRAKGTLLLAAYGNIPRTGIYDKCTSARISQTYMTYHECTFFLIQKLQIGHKYLNNTYRISWICVMNKEKIRSHLLFPPQPPIIRSLEIFRPPNLLKSHCFFDLLEKQKGGGAVNYKFVL